MFYNSTLWCKTIFPYLCLSSFAFAKPQEEAPERDDDCETAGGSNEDSGEDSASEDGKGPDAPDSQPPFEEPPQQATRTPEKVSTPLDIIEIKDTPCKVEIEENTSPNNDGLGVEETEGLPVQDVQEVVQQMSDMNLGGPESFEETQVEVPDQGWKEDQAVDPEWREKRMKKLKQELDAARKRMTSMTFVWLSYASFVVS